MKTSKLRILNNKNRNRFYCLLVAICLSSAALAQSGVKKIWHDGINREYFVHIPKNYNANISTPLILALHGAGDTAYMFKYYSGFDKIADEENFIVVYPQGHGEDGKYWWNVDGIQNKRAADDVGFINSLLEMLVNLYNIDSKRIYVAGMSNGGFMSFALACNLSEKITAIASVTGSMTPKTIEACSVNNAMPVLIIHGTADKVIPYEGRPKGSLPIPKVVEFWSDFNECNPKFKKRKLPDIDKTDGSVVEKYTYKNKKTKVKVVHYKVINGRHDWFGERSNRDIRTAQVIWDFFKDYKIQE